MAAVRLLNARAMREGAISVSSVSTVGGRAGGGRSGAMGGGGAPAHVGDVRRPTRAMASRADA